MALKLGPAVLVIISFVSILVGIIFHAISIDEVQFRSPGAQHFDNNVIIDDKLDSNLVWFLQVTDLHLSVKNQTQREKDFNDFARNYVELIKPDVVLVTGDITDGRKPNTLLGSGQQLEEWMAYSNAIARSNEHNKNTTVWLDIRGNHDNFNVYRPKDPNNLYRKYSVQGKNHEKNYMHILEKEGKNYTFIGIDEVQTPGVKLPFDFLGYVGDDDMRELKQFKEEAKKLNSQYTIWFAHYPTSSIASVGEGLRNIVDGPYLCGHFHTIGNWVVKMHATQQPGYAEVELGDWKYNRRIRLASIDHQLFSLVDLNFKQFPIALMTNPKTAEHVMPKYEPVGRIRNSTHMRVIAFSNATITRVSVSVDGGPREVMQLVKSPLYVKKWTPEQYEIGLHTVEIFVEDKEGKKISYIQKFSLDGNKDEFSFGARMLIRTYFKCILMTGFYFITSICTFPLIILRLINYRHQESGIKRHYKGTFLFNLHQVSNIDRLFWPLIIVPIWMSVGPLFIGRLVDEAIGVCFVWGIILDGNFLHTALTFNAGSIFMLFVHVPNSILLVSQVSNCRETIKAENRAASILNLKFLAYLTVTALQIWMGFVLWSAYGTMSYFTSFPFTWCLGIYAFCWYQCTTIEQRDLAKFNEPEHSQEEQQALTGQRQRDDKSSTSDTSTC